ncbi:putative RING finger domain protein, partial [Aspergillus ruber CBS 135680]
LIIALGVGLSVVTLIIMCLLYAPLTLIQRVQMLIYVYKSPSERRLRKLDAESPICTLEEWWSRAKIPPLPSDDECDQFTCAICLDSVLRSHEIRDLKCLHVFHRECLDKWYLQDQFHCPLCHRAYFKQQFQPTNEFVWMV